MNSIEEHDKYMSLIQGMTHFSHVCFTTAMKKLDLDFSIKDYKYILSFFI